MHLDDFYRADAERARPIAAGVPVDERDERGSTVNSVDLHVSEKTRGHYRALFRLGLETGPSSTPIEVLRYLSKLDLAEREALIWAASTGRLTSPVPARHGGRG